MEYDEVDKRIDIILAESAPNATFCAILTVAQDKTTKILRRAMASCPLKAVREIVQRLQVDTAMLFSAFLFPFPSSILTSPK